ncbi:MAG: AAA family ATPase [Actinomycetota bacterium]
MSGPVDDLEPLTPAEIRQLGMEPTEDGWRPADPPAREDEERSTWEPQDLGPVLRGEVTEEPPSILRWGDDLCLIYAGKLHWWQGEPESGKTWLALHASAELLGAGRTVVYMDLEDSPAGIVSRLRALGVTEEEIVARFRYLRPEERMDDRARTVLAGLLDELQPALVVVDGVTEMAQLHGLDPVGTRDVAELIAILRPFRRTGAAVVALDHVTKDRETRGRWALGSQHKLAGIDGAALLFRLREPFGRSREGVAALEVAKDRPGFLRGQAGAGKSLGQMHLVPDGEAVRVEFRPAGTGTRNIVQVRILAVMRESADEYTSTSAIQDAVARDGSSIVPQTRTIQKHLALLAEEGLVDRMGTGAGQEEFWTAHGPSAEDPTAHGS